jgi:hypothetical protein
MSQAESPPQPPLVRIPARIGRFVRKRYGRWRNRHQDPLNFRLHLAGIPIAVAGLGLVSTPLWPAALLAESGQLWAWGLGVVVAGYALQYIGHRVEGNDVGEWAGIKAMLGLPYVAVSPRWQGAGAEAPPAESVAAIYSSWRSAEERPRP